MKMQKKFVRAKKTHLSSDVISDSGVVEEKDKLSIAVTIICMCISFVLIFLGALMYVVLA